MAKAQPIIVIKKKGGHGGHHGGAWKVAYADFVTAMMALFIVLWLMAQNDPVKKAVAGYFNDPRGTGNLLGTTLSGTGAGAAPAADKNAKQLQDLKEKLEKEIQERKDLQKLVKQIEITITPEGLRIELIEGKNGTFYQSGSAQLSPSGQELLALLAAELKTLPNQLLIEGHTDAAQYSTDANYSNWELSADRANSARRLLQQDGVRRDQVTQVRGFADQMLRVRSNPYRSVEPAYHDPGEESGQRGAGAAVEARSNGQWRFERAGSGRRGAVHGAQGTEPASNSAGQFGKTFRASSCESGKAVCCAAGREAGNHGQADPRAAWREEIDMGDFVGLFGGTLPQGLKPAIILRCGCRG